MSSLELPQLPTTFVRLRGSSVAFDDNMQPSIAEELTVHADKSELKRPSTKSGGSSRSVRSVSFAGLVQEDPKVSGGATRRRSGVGETSKNLNGEQDADNNNVHDSMAKDRSVEAPNGRVPEIPKLRNLATPESSASRPLSSMYEEELKPTSALAIRGARQMKDHLKENSKKWTKRKPKAGRLGDSEFRHPLFSRSHSFGKDREGEHRDIVNADGADFYTEFPGLLDGFFLLNQVKVGDPLDVYSIDISDRGLYRVIEDDLTLFNNLHEVDAAENALSMSMLASFQQLQTLRLPFNSIVDLDPGVSGKFRFLTTVDLAYNALSQASLITLATLPALEDVDLTGNNIQHIPLEVLRVPTEPSTESVSQDSSSQKHGDNPDVVVTKEVDISKNPAQGQIVSMIGDIASEERNITEDEDAVESSASAVEPRDVTSPETENVGKDSNVEAELFPSGDDLDIASADPIKSTSASTEHIKGKDEGQSPQTDQTELLNGRDAQPETSVPVDAVKLPSIRSSRRESRIGTPSPAERIRRFIRTPIDGNVCRVGFQSLKKLNLEDNHVRGALAFSILGKLPCLQILNLNRNRIRSLKWLSITDLPSSKNDISSSQESLSFDGFYALEELSIAFNWISTEEDLMGVVHLPALKRLYLEGNPVARIKNSTKSKIDTGVRSPVPRIKQFNPLYVLPTYYNIQVADVVFMKPPDLPRFTTWKSRLRKKNDGILAPLTHHDFHYVEEPVLRAPPKLSESEIEEMLKEEKQGQVDERILVTEEDRRVEDTRSMEQLGQLVRGNDYGTESKSLLVYDPDTVDSTFLTGVHITSGQLVSCENTEDANEFGVEGENGLDRETGFDEEHDNASTNLTTMEEEDDEDQSIFDGEYFGPPFPTKIQGAVRALRNALRNPVYYWRGIDTHYAQPTFAAKAREFARVVELEEKTRARTTKLGKPRKEVESDVAFMSSSSDLFESVREPPNTAQTPALRLTTGKSTAKKGDMDDLENMMYVVDQKLKIVERNLASVLASDEMKLRIPESHALFNQMHREYERISNISLDVPHRSTSLLPKSVRSSM